MYTLHTLAILSVKKKSSSIVYDLKKTKGRITWSKGQWSRFTY